MKPKQNYVPGPSDLYQTPGYGLEPLSYFISLSDYDRIWECAAGEGYLVSALSKYVDEVIGTDIEGEISRDFLFWKPKKDIDAIITNPPYSMKKEFTKRCYELEKPWALLMPSETVGNKWFIPLANQNNPKPGIIWVSYRIHFKLKGQDWENSMAPFNIAWFTWNMGFEGNKFIYMDHWTKEYRERFEI